MGARIPRWDVPRYRISHFLPLDEFARRMERRIALVKSTPPGQGVR
jgi:hypothetical protein